MLQRLGKDDPLWCSRFRNRHRDQVSLSAHRRRSSVYVNSTGLSATDNRKLERQERRAARRITRERLGDHEQLRGNIEHDLLLSRAGLSSLSSRRRVALCMLAFDFVHCRLPAHCRLFFQTWCPTKPERSILLRPNTSNLIRLPKPNTFRIQRSRPRCIQQFPSGTPFAMPFEHPTLAPLFTLPSKNISPEYM